MTATLTFEQRSEDLWVADLGDDSYRIELHDGRLRPDYDVEFVERRTVDSVFGSRRVRYTSVSSHRTLARAMERANRHHRDRAKNGHTS